MTDKDEIPKAIKVIDNLLYCKYVFAKTSPKQPHYYTLRKTWKNEQDFIDAVLFIRRYGKKEIYRGYIYTKYEMFKWKYWTMGSPIEETILINKAKNDFN